jgi:hypothetical protein
MYASILFARNAGRRIDIACEIAFKFSPQPRQNLDSSSFSIPHLGQNIYAITTLAMANRNITLEV